MLGNLGPVSTYGNLIALGQVLLQAKYNIGQNWISNTKFYHFLGLFLENFHGPKLILKLKSKFPQPMFLGSVWQGFQL